jgi:hypothetical protein
MLVLVMKKLMEVSCGCALGWALAVVAPMPSASKVVESKAKCLVFMVFPSVDWSVFCGLSDWFSGRVWMEGASWLFLPWTKIHISLPACQFRTVLSALQVWALITAATSSGAE